MKKFFLIVILLYPFLLIAQIITTFAGSNTCGYSGNGMSATTAQLGYPAGGVFDAQGSYYFYEKANERVRKVTALGIISTVAGKGTAGFSGDGGPATDAELNQPEWVAVDAVGNVYISDFSNYRIRKVDTTGVIHTIAGNGTSLFSGDGGAATAATLFAPSGICIDDTGNIYECEVDRIRKINTAGIINTIVGNGIPGFSGDGGAAINAEFDGYFIFMDNFNNLYIADEENYRVRKVTAANGIINTIAGNGIPSYSGDGGLATAAEVKPIIITLDAFGNLFIADGNQRIRKVDRYGIITTLAGTGVPGFNGDNGSATAAQIYNPQGIAVDSCGNIYITDDANCRIRKITYPHCDYLAIKSIKEDASLNIYPNPTNDILNIDNLKTQAAYRLLSIVGSVVQQGNLKEGSNSIDIVALANGMYMLEIIDKEGKRTVTKIIKQ